MKENEAYLITAKISPCPSRIHKEYRIRFGKRYKTILGAFDALANFKKQRSLWYTSITNEVRTEFHLSDYRIEHNYNKG